MIQNYREDDGMDPGLGDLGYDGTEYELDEFGERVGSEDLFEDEAEESEMVDEPASDSATADVTEADKRREDAFGETLNPDENPHIGDQLEDDQSHEAAKADYAEGEMPATDESMGDQDTKTP
jgi:hypothetical protein